MYLSGIWKSSHLLPVSPFASHSKTAIDGKKQEEKQKIACQYWKWKTEIYVTDQTCCNTGVNKILLGTILIIGEFYNFIFLFDILAPNDTRQFILILWTV